MKAPLILLGVLLTGSIVVAGPAVLAEEPADVEAGESVAAPEEDAGESSADAATSPGSRESGLHRPLNRAAAFAPAGVIMDHTHQKRDWTFSYRYVRMKSEDLLAGTDPVDIGDALAVYDSVPTEQVINRHLFGVMYAPRDRFTFALSLPYIENEVEVTDGSSRHKWRTRGIGDAQLLFLIPFVQKGEEMTHVRVGMSFPTGSIFETDDDGSRLPYAMQLGSGTWDIQWAITYTGAHRRLSWGSQFEGQYRIGTNEIGYRLGTDYLASIWMTGSLLEWVSISGRFAWKRLGNIHGADPTLDKTVNPLNDNMNRAGTRLEIGPGLNILLPFLGAQRLAMEVVIPVYQDLDGPQLSEKLTFTAGWQWLF